MFSLEPFGTAARRVLVLAALAWTPVAHADWLITLEGRMIETQGPWTIEGEVLTYVDLEGQEHSLSVDDVDLEASEETTALKAGREYVPRQEPEVQESKKEARKRNKKAKVILYMTSLCKECQRARELLEALDVEFVEKDINSGRKTRFEYQRKAGHGGGVPVIDIDGAIVFSNNPRVIRKRVAEYKARMREASKQD